MSRHRDWRTSEIRAARRLASRFVSAADIARQLGRPNAESVTRALRYSGTPISALRREALEHAVTRRLGLGLTRHQIAKQIGCHPDTVSNTLRRLELDARALDDRRKHRQAGARHAAWASRRMDGEPVQSIAAAEGVSYQAVWDALRRFEQRSGIQLPAIRPARAAK